VKSRRYRLKPPIPLTTETINPSIMMAAENNAVVKTTFDGNICRFPVQGDAGTFEALLDSIGKKHEIEPGSFTLRYVDGDGDEVNLTSAEDFVEALTVANELPSSVPGARPVLRIMVRKLGDVSNKNNNSKHEKDDGKKAEKKKAEKEKKLEEKIAKKAAKMVEKEKKMEEKIEKVVSKLKNASKDGKPASRVDEKLQWLNHVEKLSQSTSLRAQLGPMKMELLSIGGGPVFIKAAEAEQGVPGTGRLRIVPVSVADGEYLVDFNAGFGPWAKFEMKQLGGSRSGVAFRNVGSGRYLSLSDDGQKFVPSAEPYAFELRGDTDEAVLTVSDMKPVTMDAALKMAKEMMKEAKAREARAVKDQPKDEGVSHAGKRLVGECDSIMLGSVPCKLLKLAMGRVCIQPVQPTSSPLESLGDGNVRVRTGSPLDFRGRRGRWAQFDVQLDGGKLVFRHPATGSFLGTSAGALTTEAVPFGFDVDVSRLEALAAFVAPPKPCQREGCTFAAHSEQGHGHCCRACAHAMPCGHGPHCRRQLCERPLPMAEEVSTEAVADAESEATPAWRVLSGKDAFAGDNAYIMPAGDLDACRKECEQRGFGAFVVWRGTAYFRSQTAQECAANQQDQPEGTLHLSVGEALTKEAEKVAKKAAKEACKAAKHAAKEEEKAAKKAAKEEERANKLHAKAAKEAAKNEVLKVMLGASQCEFRRMPNGSFCIRVVRHSNGAEFEGNVRLVPKGEVRFDAGSGKWAQFKLEHAPFEQVYLKNEATGLYLGLDRTEVHLATCDGFKFQLKDWEGAPLQSHSTSTEASSEEWENVDSSSSAE